MAKQFQSFLDDSDFLDPFSSRYGAETAMVTLADDLWRAVVRWAVSLLILLDISAAFGAVNGGTLLERLVDMSRTGSTHSC